MIISTCIQSCLTMTVVGKACTVQDDRGSCYDDRQVIVCMSDATRLALRGEWGNDAEFWGIEYSLVKWLWSRLLHKFLLEVRWLLDHRSTDDCIGGQLDDGVLIDFCLK